MTSKTKKRRVTAHIVLRRLSSAEPVCWFDYIGTFSTDDDARRAGEATQGVWQVWPLIGRKAEEVHRECMSMILPGPEGPAVSMEVLDIFDDCWREWASMEQKRAAIDRMPCPVADYPPPPVSSDNDPPAPVGGIDGEIVNTIRTIYGGFADLDKEKKKDGPSFDWSG